MCWQTNHCTLQSVFYRDNLYIFCLISERMFVTFFVFY